MSIDVPTPDRIPMSQRERDVLLAQAKEEPCLSTCLPQTGYP